MGRRTRSRKHGSSPRYRSHSFRRIAPAVYPLLDRNTVPIKGKVLSLQHDPGRGSPLAEIELENGLNFFTVACESIFVGQEITVGNKNSPSTGDIVPLEYVPEGTYVFNVERRAMDGGALFRTSGNYAIITGKSRNFVSVKDAKGRPFVLPSKSFASIGIAAGGGIKEKPFLKAGSKFKIMHSRSRRYPTVRGVAMAAVHHPHGGGRHQHLGGSSSVSRRLPPGAKVGLISPRRTGRRK